MSNITANNLFDFFDKEIARQLAELNIANEQLTRPYPIGIMRDEEVDADYILLETMSNFSGEVMPIINRGKAPSQDSLPKVTLSEVPLMHYWVELPLTEQTIIQTMNRVNRMRSAGKTEKEIVNMVNQVFGLNHSMRLQRWQDRLALQVCQVLSNYDLTGDFGFTTENTLKNDLFTYKIEGLDPVIDGSAMNPANTITPAIHPVQYILDNLVSKTKEDANEIWMGDNWVDWFMKWPGWTQNYQFKTPEKVRYTPAGTSQEVDAKGVSLIHESNGFRFMHINKEVKVSDNNGIVTKKKIFNPNSIICLNRETLGSVVFAPMYLEKENPNINMISDNSKLNYYQDWSTNRDIHFAGKGSKFLSGGKCLGAITGIESIQRMTMKKED